MHRPTIRSGFPAIALMTALACTDATRPVTPDLGPLATRLTANHCKPAPPDNVIQLPIAPPSSRVDLAAPTFSRSTQVTNALFPIRDLQHAVLVGQVNGEQFRAETTLMPSTKTIEFEGGQVENLVSQYVAFLGGRLHEVALDWYAQADDGSVWYFGEDVFNYEDGRVADTHGTWISCKDGPPAMIMPARPRVGDVFRVENIYPLVFEEVDVTQVNQTVPGPLSPAKGAIIVRQLHLDGSYAPKTFAPGYGEFSTGSGADIEALAVAVPINRAQGGVPQPLKGILEGADEVYESAVEDKWSEAEEAVADAEASWERYRASGAVPALLDPLMAQAMSALADAVSDRDAEAARQAAVEVGRQGLDLLVRHAAPVTVDLGRLAVFTHQLALDADLEDQGGARGTLVVMGLILDRLEGSQDRKLRMQLSRIRTTIANVLASTERGDYAAVSRGAAQLERLIDR